MTCSTCHPLHACGLKRGRGTWLGLICCFFSQTLTLLSLHEWVRECGHGHFAQGQGLGEY